MRRARANGFTTMELMIVLGIIGLTLAASWGNIQSVLRQQRLTGATNQLTTHLRLAREKAVAEGNNFIVTFRVGLNDYQIWDDEGNDALLGPDDSRRRGDPRGRRCSESPAGPPARSPSLRSRQSPPAAQRPGTKTTIGPILAACPSWTSISSDSIATPAEPSDTP